MGVRLLWEADAVFALVPQLRATGFVSDLAQLRERLTGVLLDFQARARAGGIAASRLTEATEVLCALLDHVVTSMPWGADAGWQPIGTPSGASSGRRPAQRLLDLARASPSDAGISELIGVALALGFDGRSRGVDGPIIDQVHDQLAPPGPVHEERIGPGRSPGWPSSVVRGSALTSWLPLWVSSLVVAALLAALFFGLEWSLAAKSDRLYARMAALNGPSAATPRPLPAPQARLAGALSQQIAEMSLLVRDEIDRSVIVVPDVRLFPPGDATLPPAGTDLLRPIAAALQRTPGRIQIIGHTDGSVARSARYPSDWELSVDRARAVQEALRGLGVAPSRLEYDGRASVEPLRAGDRNPTIGGDGRIEIVLLAGR